MAVDPYIARGIVPLGQGLPEALMQVEGMRIARERNALYDKNLQQDQARQDYLMRTDQMTRQAAAQQQQMMQDMRRAYDLMEAGDPSYALQRASQADPRFAEIYKRNPDQTIQSLRNSLAQQLGQAADPDIAARAQIDREMAGVKQAHDLALLDRRAALDAGLESQRHKGTLAEILARGDQDRQTDAAKPKDEPGKVKYSAKDISTAKTKLSNIALAREQLKNARAKFGKIQNTFSAGPGADKYTYTAAGREFDAAVNAMRSTVTGLMRVPGVGAMSDYETRLDQAKMPSRGEYESVTDEQMKNIDVMLDQLEKGYAEILGVEPTGGGMPKPGDIVKGYRFKGGDPSKQENWVKP